MAKANVPGAKRDGKAARRSQLSQRIVSVIVLVLAVAMIIVGVYGVNLRGGEEGTSFLTEMRARAVLATTGEGAVEAYVKAAQDAARAKVKAEGGGMSAIREAVNKAEEQARAEAKNSLADYATLDTAPLDAAIDQVELSVRDYRIGEPRQSRLHRGQEGLISRFTARIQSRKREMAKAGRENLWEIPVCFRSFAFFAINTVAESWQP
jgi:hypothetical protein